MPREFSITMTAANRTGILTAVTNAMAELGGDLCETSQTVVRGYFTMIFAAEFPDELDPQVIVDHLEGVCRPFGISLGIRDAAEQPGAVDNGRERAQFLLKIGGSNEPGVLRRIAARLSIDAIDVAGMHASRSDDMTSFHLTMKLAIPENVDRDLLLRDIRQIGEECGFEAELHSRG